MAALHRGSSFSTPLTTLVVSRLFGGSRPDECEVVVSIRISLLGDLYLFLGDVFV